MKILFVCTGNTCRSPMAKAIAEDYCKNRFDFEIDSAGLFINDIDGVSNNAVMAMKEMGIDISDHIPTQLTLDIANNADIIVPMTKNHALTLCSYGISEDKIKPLGAEIPDPYMCDIDVYRKCRDVLKEEIEKMLEGMVENDTKA